MRKILLPALSIVSLLAFSAGGAIAQSSAQAPGKSQTPGKKDDGAPRAERAPEGPVQDPADNEPRKRPFHRVPGASSVPDDPAQRAKLLSDLYAHLATSEDEAAAQSTAAAIERVWLSGGGDTVGLLMERALGVHKQKNADLALKLLDAVTELAPDYPEGWNRRAYILYMENDTSRALGDLRRVLALDPNHFKALDGLGQILREIGQKKAALEVYRKLLDVHPFWPGAKDVVAELEREVKGQGI